MSRKVGAQRALAEPDPIYKSRLVTLLVRRIMKSGKKSLAQKIVYNALEVISSKTEENPVITLERAVKNVIPRAKVKHEELADLFIRYRLKFVLIGVQILL